MINVASKFPLSHALGQGQTAAAAFRTSKDIHMTVSDGKDKFILEHKDKFVFLNLQFVPLMWHIFHRHCGSFQNQ